MGRMLALHLTEGRGCLVGKKSVYVVHPMDLTGTPPLVCREQERLPSGHLILHQGALH